VFAFNLTSGGTVSCGCWRANPQLRATAKLKRLEDRRPAIAKLRESNDKRSQPTAPAAVAAGLQELLDQYLRSAGPPILQQLHLAADPAHPLRWRRISAGAFITDGWKTTPRIRLPARGRRGKPPRFWKTKPGGGRLKAY
jgi:hypothetical protein